MRYVRLGNTGTEVSALCLGTWMFGHDYGEGEAVDRDTSLGILEGAFERGVNFIDTANIYGMPASGYEGPEPGRSESYIGEWLKGVDRESVVIASKVFYTTRGRQPIGLSRKIVRAEIEGTLERLGTDYLDIYYHHGWHPPSPLEETLSVFNDLVREGLVHYLGVSNFTSWQLMKAAWLCDRNGWAPITVIQPRFNAADHVPFTVDPAEMALPDLFDACRDLGVSVCPYSPLAGGFLSGKYQRRDDGDTDRPEGSRAAFTSRYGPFSDRWWRVLDVVREVADDLGATAAQVAIAWAARVEGLTSIPIVGGKRVEYLDDVIGAVDLGLTDEQHESIAAAGRVTERTGYIYT